MSVRPTLRWVSILETVSFVALLGAMTSGSESAVSVTGAVHGVLFLVYAAILWFGRDALDWSWRFALAGVLTGPIGAIMVLERLRREARRPERTVA